MPAEGNARGGNAGREKCRLRKCNWAEMQAGGNSGRGNAVMQAGKNAGRGKRRQGEVQAGDRQHEEHANVHIL
jgi:hypothetical protein